MSVIIPGSARPNNLVYDGAALMLEGDVLNICERVRKEVSEDLFIVIAQPERPDGKNFIVMERTKDGDKMVKRYEALDSRIIEDLQYMIKVPFEHRIKLLEQENEAYEAAQKEEQLEELYEDVGRRMWTQLEKDGFINTRPVSFPKKGVTSGTS